MNHRNEILNRTTKSHHFRSNKLNHLPAKLNWSRYRQRKKRMSHIIKQGIYQTAMTHAKPLNIFLSF